MSDEALLALAGTFQSAALVDALATTGSAEPAALAASIESIYAQDADSVLAVYGGDAANLGVGIECLLAVLDRRPEATRAARHAFHLLLLERRLSRRPELLETIAAAVADARRQARHLGSLHDQVLARLADLYRETISTLRPRIVVHGRPEHLQQATLVAKIRALLLAGIRSAVLWQQLGGRRWQLLLRRSQLAERSRALEAQVQASR